MNIISKNRKKELQSNPSKGSNQIKHDSKLRDSKSNSKNDASSNEPGNILVLSLDFIMSIEFVDSIDYGVELHGVAEYHVHSIQSSQNQKVRPLFLQP